MKTLLLVRHAKSDWSDGTLSDFDRPLNARGQHDAPKMAALLRESDLQPLAMVTSPANRAYTTARLFAEAFGFVENDLSVREDLYEAPKATILLAIRDLPDHASVAAIFGHNPGMTTAVQSFSDEYITNVPTCGVAVIKLDIPKWSDFRPGTSGRLEVLLTPKEVLSGYEEG